MCSKNNTLKFPTACKAETKLFSLYSSSKLVVLYCFLSFTLFPSVLLPFLFTFLPSTNIDTLSKTLCFPANNLLILLRRQFIFSTWTTWSYLSPYASPVKASFFSSFWMKIFSLQRQGSLSFMSILLFVYTNTLRTVGLKGKTQKALLPLNYVKMVKNLTYKVMEIRTDKSACILEELSSWKHW